MARGWLGVSLVVCAVIGPALSAGASGMGRGAMQPAPSHRDENNGLKKEKKDQKKKDGEEQRTLVSFDFMYGVDGPFVGDSNAVRDVPGDELPWQVKKATGKLETDGHLKITIHGLVFKEEEGVPPDIQGKNDEAEFRGLVSCLTEEGDAVVTKNVMTEGFPATLSGNSKIDAKLELPNPCVAPIVMVLAGSEFKWFALNGFEAEEREGDDEQGDDEADDAL